MDSIEKIKLTQQEFDDVYEIEIPDKKEEEQKEEFLTEEEEKYDDALFETLEKMEDTQQ